jgi:hypothetical protein
LPPEAAHFIKAVFFDYTDRVVADAQRNHIATSLTPWSTRSSALRSVSSSGCIVMSELRAAAKSGGEGALNVPPAS